MTPQSPSPQPFHPLPQKPFQPAALLALPHGIAVMVALPDPDQGVPEDVLQALLPPEREFVAGLSGHRQVNWVGGRLALHEAMRHLKAPEAPLLSLPSGAVDAPPGLVASVSHKRSLAVGMVGYAVGGTLGVDLEDMEPHRLHLAPRLLTPREISQLEELPPERRWMDLLLRFSMKEALFKAIHPHLQRYVGFHEVEVSPRPSGRARVKLLMDDAGDLLPEARHHWLDSRVLTSVRILLPAVEEPQESAPEPAPPEGPAAPGQEEQAGAHPPAAAGAPRGAGSSRKRSRRRRKKRR